MENHSSLKGYLSLEYRQTMFWKHTHTHRAVVLHSPAHHLMWTLAMCQTQCVRGINCSEMPAPCLVNAICRNQIIEWWFEWRSMHLLKLLRLNHPSNAGRYREEEKTLLTFTIYLIHWWCDVKLCWIMSVYFSLLHTRKFAIFAGTR